MRRAYPNRRPIWGADGDYGGHRAPRDHTIALRLQRSNVIWMMPAQLASLTIESVRLMVRKAGG